MSAAARFGDQHDCPKTDGTKAHKGGPIIDGIATVLIGNKPAAVQGSQCKCLYATNDTITQGSDTVFVNNKRAARKGDATQHGGKITSGCESVDIG